MPTPSRLRMRLLVSALALVTAAAAPAFGQSSTSRRPAPPRPAVSRADTTRQAADTADDEDDDAKPARPAAAQGAATGKSAAGAAPSAVAPAAHRDSGTTRVRTGDDDDDDATPPFAYGLSSGGAAFTDGRTQQGVGAVLEYRVRSWLSLSANPSVVRGQDSVGMTRSAGPGDLPVSAAVTLPVHARFDPSLGFALDASFPTGNTSTGLGSGETGFSAQVGAGFSPMERLTLDVGAEHGLYGSQSGSAFQGVSTTELSVAASADVLPRVGLNLGYTTEAGPMSDGTVRPQGITGGFNMKVAGPLTFNVEAGHALAGDGQRWSLSAGFGTAFAGITTVGPNSAMNLLSRSGILRRKVKGLLTGNGKGSGKSTTTTSHGHR